MSWSLIVDGRFGRGVYPAVREDWHGSKKMVSPFNQKTIIGDEHILYLPIVQEILFHPGKTDYSPVPLLVCGRPSSKNNMAKGKPGTAQGAVTKWVKMVGLFRNGS